MTLPKFLKVVLLPSLIQAYRKKYRNQKMNSTNEKKMSIIRVFFTADLKKKVLVSLSELSRFEELNSDLKHFELSLSLSLASMVFEVR